MASNEQIGSAIDSLIKSTGHEIVNSQSDEAPQIYGQGFTNMAFIELHKIHGNRWKKISGHFQDKRDVEVKNHFYCLLRKALRKLNSYIKASISISKNYKPLKLNFIFKLANLAEFERYDISTKKHYKDLLYDFLSLVHQFNPNQELKQEKKENLEENQIFCDFNIRILESIKQVEKLFIKFKLNNIAGSRKKCSKKLRKKKDAILNLQHLGKTEIDSEQKINMGIENIHQNLIAQSIWRREQDFEAEMMSFNQDDQSAVENMSVDFFEEQKDGLDSSLFE